MTDSPRCLTLVSPNLITRDWDGSLFAELEASFSLPSLRYHAIGKFSFALEDVERVTRHASQCPGGLKVSEKSWRNTATVTFLTATSRCLSSELMSLFRAVRRQ